MVCLSFSKKICIYLYKKYNKLSNILARILYACMERVDIGVGGGPGEYDCYNLFL